LAAWKALSFRRDDRQASVREFADEFGRRLAPRDQDAEIWEHPTGDTARMPILNVEIEDAPENFDTNNVDLDLSEAAGATEEPEPDLQQIFEAAARGEAGIEEEMLAGAQGEEIVLSSAPDPVVEPVELAPPQIEKVKELRRRQLPAVNLKAAASIAAAVLLLSVFAWLWSGDAEESLPPQVAAVPETGTSAEVTAGSIEREAPVTEQAAQTESAAEPAATAQPVAEQVPEPQVEQPVEKETVVAPPVAEPTVEQVTETLVGPPVDQAADTQTTVGPPVEQVAEAQVPDEPEVLEGLVVGSLVGAQTSPAVQASAAEQGATGQQSEPDFDPNEQVPLAELEFVRFVEPEYPARALNRRYDGAVVVEFRVNTEGKTRDIEIVESELPSRFNSPSVAAVKKWRFEPYLREGQPVEVSSRVRLRYAN
jgi:protein TonB